MTEFQKKHATTENTNNYGTADNWPRTEFLQKTHESMLNTLHLMHYSDNKALNYNDLDYVSWSTVERLLALGLIQKRGNLVTRF